MRSPCVFRSPLNSSITRLSYVLHILLRRHDLRQPSLRNTSLSSITRIDIRPAEPQHQSLIESPENTECPADPPGFPSPAIISGDLISTAECVVDENSTFEVVYFFPSPYPIPCTSTLPPFLGFLGLFLLSSGEWHTIWLVGLWSAASRCD
jgi:hypothetical protein